MSYSKVYSAQCELLKVTPISVETDTSRGLYSLNIVGLPDKAVEEARDRVSAAIKNSGFDSPKSKNQRVIISLAPADIKKEGTHFDIAIALSYLSASEELKFDSENKIFLGELSLDGKARSIKGVLPVSLFAKENGYTEIFVPKENEREASLIDGVTVYSFSNLYELVMHLKGEKLITPVPQTIINGDEFTSQVDFGDVLSQDRAKRGLTIAAAGGHNVAMYGPPGTGKTMLAKAFAGILPKLSFTESIEVTGIHSIAGTLSETFIINPPFRSPHHTSSYVSLVGGGAVPRPGEITLAHRGVLFMDEFPEFDRRVIESLRQPLEDKLISVARAKGTSQFPANFILVAAMNPCPCGNYGFRGKACTCSALSLARYRRKLSGPIMERIDLWLEVDRISPDELSKKKSIIKESDEIRKKIQSARAIQAKRFEGKKILKNSEMSTRDMVTHVRLENDALNTLNLATQRLGFSPRVYHKLIKVARTIADLDESENIKNIHILEAIEYRPKKFDI